LIKGPIFPIENDIKFRLITPASLKYILKLEKYNRERRKKKREHGGDNFSLF
jgi:hypothetical protein